MEDGALSCPNHQIKYHLNPFLAYEALKNAVGSVKKSSLGQACGHTRLSHFLGCLHRVPAWHLGTLHFRSGFLLCTWGAVHDDQVFDFLPRRWETLMAFLTVAGIWAARDGQFSSPTPPTMCVSFCLSLSLSCCLSNK